MKNFNLIASGVEYTSDSFVTGTKLYFRRNVTKCESSESGLKSTSYSSFHVYDINGYICETIDAKKYYEEFFLFRLRKGISKAEEKLLYDKVMENNFVMYCLLTSDYL